MDEMGTGPGEHRMRRPHRKSRNGCSKCKERRIKCDEQTPRCSRCTKMDLPCQYPKRQPDLLAADDYWVDSGLSLGLGLGNSSAGAASPESSGASPLSSSSSARVPPSPSPLRSHIAQTLAPAEFELLKHYLDHTSKDLTMDDEDQYTLQVGIPNLACQSKPLMRSVMALAAVCKSCDVIRQPIVSHEDRLQVLEYLGLADQYHMESLREIQTTLHQSKHYDHVLANAAMMGMYGSGSHRIRIWLAKTASFADPPLGPDFVPKHCQWISLYRAVDLAYVGLLSNSNTPRTEADMLSPARSPVDFAAAAPGMGMSYDYKVSSRIEQPRAMPNHPLGPILAATIGPALAKLQEKANEIAILDPKLDGTNNPDLQACFTALAIFSTTVTETFSVVPPEVHSQNIGVGTLNGSHFAFEVDIDPVGRLSEISPWLRRYTASITNMIPSRLPRRVIVGFIHKVSPSYLTLVEEMISAIQIPDPSDHLEGEMAGWVPEVPVESASLAHQLAMEIFAHWLVLVILLDNVWWIGGIGAWELGRIVATLRAPSRRWIGCLWMRDEHWWPESMWEISRQFNKHRTDG